MKLLLAIGTYALVISAAHAQYSLGDMENRTIQQCTVGQIPGHPAYDEKFCSCWVQTWVHLWNNDDFNEWQAGHPATPHMAAVEDQAADRCGGYPR